MPERQPRPTDNDLIDRAADEPTPSQSGSAGGNVARRVGMRDEERTATGGDPELTRVRKGDEPEGGDVPDLQQRPRPR